MSQCTSTLFCRSIRTVLCAIIFGSNEYPLIALYLINPPRDSLIRRDNYELIYSACCTRCRVEKHRTGRRGRPLRPASRQVKVRRSPVPSTFPLFLEHVHGPRDSHFRRHLQFHPIWRLRSSGDREEAQK